MKVLVVRFSSIGDIVLTTPVLRALRNQLPGCEIHYLTKHSMAGVLDGNPNIDTIHTIDKSIDEVVKVLRSENFDHVVDLHNNIRTLSLKWKLRRPFSSFPKLNLRKWLLVKMKLNQMPKTHVVDRYFKAVECLGVRNDGLPCDFPIAVDQEVDLASLGVSASGYIALVIGAKFRTKQLPFNKLTEVIAALTLPVVLIGGKEDRSLGDEVVNHFPEKLVLNTCGDYSLKGSASLVRQAKSVLTNDTGMMHIASCYNVPIVSVWGNTLPALGMYPYRPGSPDSFSIHEVKDLKCRPCSKIGFAACPKGHFKCMQQQDSQKIAQELTT